MAADNPSINFISDVGLFYIYGLPLCGIFSELGYGIVLFVKDVLVSMIRKWSSTLQVTLSCFTLR